MMAGRNFLRCWHGRESSNLEVIAINDSGVSSRRPTSSVDSIPAPSAAVKTADDNHISIDGKSIEIVSSRDPLRLLEEARRAA